MAGHSHWKNIKRKKEAADKKRSKLFTKAAQKIIAALRSGDANPDTNYELKIALEYAKQVRMPKDNIARLIDKYKGAKGDQGFSTVIYEILGPKGVPILVKAVTDNTNRTLTQLRSFLRKSEGRLVDKGALMWQFSEIGRIVIKLQNESADDFVLKIMDLIDINDYTEEDGNLVLYVTKDKTSEYTKILLSKGYTVLESDIGFVFVGQVSENISKPELEEFIELLKDEIPDIMDTWTIAL